MKKILIFIVLIFNALNNNAKSEISFEKLNRGLLVQKTETGCLYISWRLLKSDASGTGFNIYQSTDNSHFIRVNRQPVLLTTDTVINEVQKAETYRFFVVPVCQGKELISSEIVTLQAKSAINNFRLIPLKKANHFVQHIWPGDLDGDGAFELIVSRLPLGNGNALLEAYTLDGKFLWRIDLGPQSVSKSTENGANDSPSASISGFGNVAGYRDNDNVTVFDLNNDGKAEVFVRTAQGVVFADGKVLKSTGNRQFISVIGGMSGKEISRISVPDDFIDDGPVGGHFGIAFLDSKNPSLIVKLKNRQGNSRGKFNQFIAAYDFKNNKLIQKWKIIPEGVQSFHQIHILDVDNDGNDEICDGSYVIDSNGKLLYQIPGVIHGDRFHIADIDPDKPGMEGYGIQQMEGGSQPEFPWYYYDAATGEILFSGKEKNVDTGRGSIADIDPNHRGMDMSTSRGIYNVKGEKISENTPPVNFRIWWDGDLQDEILDKMSILKWNPETHTSFKIFAPNGLRYNSRDAPPFYGDILGDWREEVIWESANHTALKIFSTTIPSKVKMITPLQNRAYRLCLTVKGYMQSTLPDTFPIR